MSTQAPIEDINTIMNRFQAWTGAQQAVGKSAAGKPKVRELTYEEAVARGRRGSAETAMRRKPEAAAVAKKAEKSVPVKAASEKISSPKASSANAISSEVATKLTRSAVSRKKKKAVRRAATALAVSKPQMAAPSIVTSVPAQSFRRALTESVAVMAQQLTISLTASSRNVSISIRLSEMEQAVLKARAETAGLNVSAYLRQCALEVEQRHAQPSMVVSPMAPALPAPPGFFARLKQRLFGRPTTLALRA